MYIKRFDIEMKGSNDEEISNVKKRNKIKNRKK